MSTRNQEYTCPECHQPFTRKDGLTRHLRDQHPQRYQEFATWFCPHCGEGFLKRHQLYSHLQRRHAGTKEEYILDPWTGRREVREVERYPDVEEHIEKYTLEELITYIDELTLTEGVRLVAHRGPSSLWNSEERRRSDLFLQLECDVPGCTYSVDIRAKGARSWNSADGDTLKNALVQQLHRGAQAENILKAHKFIIKRTPGHTCKHRGAPRERDRPCLRLTSACVRFLFDLGHTSAADIARLIRGKLPSRANRMFLPEGMQDFVLNGDHIKDKIYEWQKHSESLVYNEERVDELYQRHRNNCQNTNQGSTQRRNRTNASWEDAEVPHILPETREVRDTETIAKVPTRAQRNAEKEPTSPLIAKVPTRAEGNANLDAENNLSAS